MTIQFDAVSNSNPFGADASFDHSVSAGIKNGILLLNIACQFDVAINSVSYGGNAATKLSSNSPSTDISSYLYYILAPPTGTNTVAVDFAAAQGNTEVVAVSYAGVDQTNPFGTEATTNGTSGATFGSALTSSTNGLCIDWAATAADAARAAVVVSSDQTERFNEVTGVGGASVAVGFSEQLGAASVTMSWTNGNSNNDYAHIAVPLQPAQALIQRDIDYFFDAHDPYGRILDVRGREVQPWKVRANTWIKVTGLFTPSGKVYRSFTQDPELAYIEEVQYSLRGGLRIKTNRGELTEVLLARAAGSKTF